MNLNTEFIKYSQQIRTLEDNSDKLSQTRVGLEEIKLPQDSVIIQLELHLVLAVGHQMPLEPIKEPVAVDHSLVHKQLHHQGVCLVGNSRHNQVD